MDEDYINEKEFKERLAKRREEIDKELEQQRQSCERIRKELQRLGQMEIKERIKYLPEKTGEKLKQELDGGNIEKIDEEISQDRFNCVMLELMYLKGFDRAPTDDNSDLYPNDWFEDPDYKKQFEILTEAVAENKKIADTNGYNELHKGRYTRQRTTSSLLISKRV